MPYDWLDIRSLSKFILFEYMKLFDISTKQLKIFQWCLVVLSIRSDGIVVVSFDVGCSGNILYSSRTKRIASNIDWCSWNGTFQFGTRQWFILRRFAHRSCGNAWSVPLYGNVGCARWNSLLFTVFYLFETNRERRCWGRWGAWKWWNGKIDRTKDTWPKHHNVTRTTQSLGEIQSNWKFGIVAARIKGMRKINKRSRHF